MSTIHSPFPSRLITFILFNTDPLSPSVDIHLHFSLKLVRKANAVEEETK
jgi:hypothetical protein